MDFNRISAVPTDTADVNEQFRTPESYHAILYAIATGKHRLSEIAKHMAVPNNQCKKYLDALIAMGLVAVKEHHYSILNSYVDFWHRYFYLKASRLVTAPSDVTSEVLSRLDEFALEKQLPECIKKLPFDIPKDAKRQYNAVFDYVFQSGSHTVLIKLPESLDWHCTKQELDALIACTNPRKYGKTEVSRTLCKQYPKSENRNAKIEFIVCDDCNRSDKYFLVYNIVRFRIW